MTILERLARQGHRAAAAVLDAFDPDQPRDEKGMWTSSGGGGTGAATTSQHESAISLHSSSAEKARSSGNGRSAALHERARQAHLDVVHKETGKGHLLGSQGMKSVEELRTEAQRASHSAHEEDKNPTKGTALAYSTKEKPSTRPSDPVHGGAMPSGWKPGVGYRPGLNDPKPREIDNAKEELTTMNFRGGSKGVTVMRAGDLPKGDEPRSRFNAGPSDPVHGGSGRRTPYNPKGDEPRSRFNAGPSDPVHGGSGRRTPYNRKEGTARERKELRETRSMEAAAKIFAKPAGQLSAPKQDFVSRSRPVGSGTK